MDVAKKVQEAGMILGALGVIGFIGIVWLMIYGNLSGNLGFSDTTTTYSNESGYAVSGTTYTLTNGASTSGFVSVSVTSLWNATFNGTGGQHLIAVGNYTVSSTAGTIVGAAGRTYNYSDVNATYVVTHYSDGKLNTENVLTNVTTGFGTFFGFSNTFFTIAAIVLLIFMLVGLLAIVMMIAKGKSGKNSGYAGYDGSKSSSGPSFSGYA